MTVESRNPDFRQTEISWIRDSGVDAYRGRIHIVIGHYDLLRETVVSDVKLIGETCIGGPDPAATDHLRPGVGLGKKHRIEYGHILLGLNAVSYEIRADQGMFFREVVIQLKDSIVFPVHVVVVQVERRSWPRIERKIGGQLFTDWAAGPSRFAFRKRIRNTERWIADRHRNRCVHHQRVSHLVAHAFVVSEDKQLIFDNRPARGSAKLVEDERSLGIR